MKKIFFIIIIIIFSNFKYSFSSNELYNENNADAVASMSLNNENTTVTESTNFEIKSANCAAINHTNHNDTDKSVAEVLKKSVTIPYNNTSDKIENRNNRNIIQSALIKPLQLQVTHFFIMM